MPRSCAHLSTRTALARFEARRLVGQPLDETAHFRLRKQLLGGIQLESKTLLAEKVVDMVVTGPAQAECSALSLLAVEALTDPASAVLTARNQVVTGQRRHMAAAESADRHILIPSGHAYPVLSSATRLFAILIVTARRQHRMPFPRSVSIRQRPNRQVTTDSEIRRV